MSNYTQTTNFATKDTLASGNPLKVVKGAEINTEFVNISTAIATKVDSNGSASLTTLSVSGLSTLSNVLLGYDTTATAAGTTTLTSSSNNQQFFTGTTTQTVVLPLTSTLALGFSYLIVNKSTGVLTVQSSGLNTITLVPAGVSVRCTCILTSGTTAASWSFSFDAGSSTAYKQIPTITATVASNALTIGLGACSLDFRSSTLSSGTVTTVFGTPANLVISSGSTLGTVSGIASRIVVIAINNAGTIELAAVNISGGNQLDETNLITTIAEGGLGAADSANVIYSTTARSSVAYRIVGFIDSTQATAGSWATAPSTIQGQGGQALAALSSVGYGQTWQTVTRTSGTTYYNTTGRPILCQYTFNGGASLSGVFTVGGVALPTFSTGTSTDGIQFVAFALVPAGMAYIFTTNGTYVSSYELR